jgi:tetratricopeptide (TPR) repeat protein
MAKQMNDARDEAGSQGSRPWFLLAMAGIVLSGIVLVLLIRSQNGPVGPIVDPAASAENNARFNKAMTLLEQQRPLLEAGKYQEAFSLAEQALALRPDLAQMHLAVAQIALQMRDYNRAEQEYQAVLARDPVDKESLFNLSTIAAVRKDYESARKQFAHAVTKVGQRTPDQSLPLIVLQAASNMDRPQVAARHMNAAIQMDRDGGTVLLMVKVYGPDVIALLAEQLELQGPAAADAAASSYALAAKDTPGDSLRARRAARAAELYLSAGRLDAALAQVRISLEADPSNPQWIVLRNRIAAADSQPSAATQSGIRTLPFGL